MNKYCVVMIVALLSAETHAAPAASLCNTTAKKAHKQLAVNASEQHLAPSVDHIENNPVVTLPPSVADVDAAHAGMYVGIEGVTRGVAVGETSPASPSPKQVHANGGRVSLGYKVDDHVSVELGYMTGLTTNETHTIPSGMVTYGERNRVTGGDASVIYHFTEHVPGLYVRGGASYMEVDRTSSTHNRTQYRNRAGDFVYADKREHTLDTGLGLVAGVGYQKAITDHIDVNAGYTRYQGIAGHDKHAINMLSVGAKYNF
jgi:opacity protein-like surface antigen